MSLRSYSALLLGACVVVAACGDTPGGTDGTTDTGTDLAEVSDVGDDADMGRDLGADEGPDVELDADAGEDAAADAEPDADAAGSCLRPPSCVDDGDCDGGEVCLRDRCAFPVSPDEYEPNTSLRWTTRVALGPEGSVTMLDVDGDGRPENLLGTVVGGSSAIREDGERLLNELIEETGFGYGMEVILDETGCGAEPGTRAARVVMHAASRDLDYDGVPDTAGDPTIRLDRSSFDGDLGPSCQLNEGSWDTESGTVTTRGGSGCALRLPLFDGSTVQLEIGSLTMRFDETVSSQKDLGDDVTVEVGGWVTVQAIVDEANRLGGECACAGIDPSRPVATAEVQGDATVVRCVQDVSGADACEDREDGTSCGELPNLCAGAQLAGLVADIESGETPGVSDAVSFGFQLTTVEVQIADPVVTPDLQAVGDHYASDEFLEWPLALRSSAVNALRNDTYVPGVDRLQAVEVIAPSGGEVTASVSEDGTRLHASIGEGWPVSGTEVATLRYTLGDGVSRSSTADVRLLIWGPTPQPELVDDDVELTWGDTDVSIDVLANDTIFEGAFVGLYVGTAGTGTVAVSEDGTHLRYTPTVAGDDRFTYQVLLWTDDGGGTEVETATVYVRTECATGTGGSTCATCPDCGVGTCDEGAGGTGLCECPAGYLGGPSCEDIDECDDPLLCAPTSDCENLEGGFDCQCPEDTIGDGVDCETPVSCDEGGDLLCLVGERCIDLTVVEDWDCVPTGTLAVAEVFELTDIGYPGSVALGEDFLLIGGSGEDRPIYYATPGAEGWEGAPLANASGDLVVADRASERGLGMSRYEATVRVLSGIGAPMDGAGEVFPDERSPALLGWGDGAAIHDGLAFITATGSTGEVGGHVYLYDISEAGLATLRDPAGIGYGGVAGYFGQSVAAGDGAFVVGATNTTFIGEAVVYTSDGAGGWTLQVLTDERLGPMGQFGWAVAMSTGGNRVVVSAPLASLDGFEGGSGVVFVYDRDDEGRFQLVGTLESVADDFGQFGYSVAVDGDRVVVGAPYGNEGTGEVYVFEPGRRAGAWVLTDRIPGVGIEGQMGASVAANNGRVLVIEPGASTATLYETVFE